MKEDRTGQESEAGDCGKVRRRCHCKGTPFGCGNSAAVAGDGAPDLRQELVRLGNHALAGDPVEELGEDVPVLPGVAGRG